MGGTRLASAFGENERRERDKEPWFCRAIMGERLVLSMDTADWNGSMELDLL